MIFKLNTPRYISSNKHVIIPETASAETNVLIACDDEIVANRLYNSIITNYKPEKEFTDEDFNEAIENAMNAQQHRVKTCNLALAVYNTGGCFVAQMGKARVLQVRPSTSEIEYDSRSQILDIYRSKAKISLLKDVKADDYIVLSSIEDVDEKAIRNMLSNVANDDAVKFSNIVKLIEKKSSTETSEPAIAVSHVAEVEGSGISLEFLKNIPPKFIAYGVAGIAVVAILAWLLISKPFSGTSSSDNSVNPDSIVSTQSANDVEFVTPSEKNDSVANVSPAQATTATSSSTSKSSTTSSRPRKKTSSSSSSTTSSSSTATDQPTATEGTTATPSPSSENAETSPKPSVADKPAAEKPAASEKPATSEKTTTEKKSSSSSSSSKSSSGSSKSSSGSSSKSSSGSSSKSSSSSSKSSSAKKSSTSSKSSKSSTSKSKKSTSSDSK